MAIHTSATDSNQRSGDEKRTSIDNLPSAGAASSSDGNQSRTLISHEERPLNISVSHSVSSSRADFVEDDDEDDGLHQIHDENVSCFGESCILDDLDEEHVGADAYLWKIDRHKGHHHLRADQFISVVDDSRFDGARALEMLQQRYTIDYGSRKLGSRPAGVQDEYHPMFYLDMLIIVGRPLCPLSRVNEQFFSNVTITFKHWRSSYQAKHNHGFQFSLHHRTFRLASASTREVWFIVMHPRHNTISEFPASHREQRRRQEEASRSSALRPHHAQFLAAYIKQIFHTDQLVGEGIEAAWKLDGPQSQNITHNKWALFQQQFMAHWGAHVADNTTDPFWEQQVPAFHAYDYGANIQITTNEYVEQLSPETSVRPSHTEEEQDDSDDDTSLASGDAVSRELFGGSINFPTNNLRSAASSSSRSASTTSSHHPNSNQLTGSAATEASPEGFVHPSATPVVASEPAPETFPPGLQQLHHALAQKYSAEGIQSIAYALAVDINCLDVSAPVGDGGQRPARCLLSDRNLVTQEFRGARDFTFYPLAFHPAYGNFSSSLPPAFLHERVLSVMRDNLSYLNNGTDALTFGYFQAYSNIKRSIRHRPEDLLVTQGIATGSLTLPEKEARASSRLLVKRQKLRRQLLGERSPDNPDASRPFARERERLRVSQEGEEFGFRMEQVVHVQMDRLQPSLRQISTALQPILQLMRFFLQEPEQYTTFLRSFPPTIFPGILIAFACLFDHALAELRQRIDQRGVDGATVAQAEGVAAIDRLGSFCFTGHPRSLMARVLRPLGTIDSIAHGGWPYLDPQLLDLTTCLGSLNLPRWPHGVEGRPLLMHVAALAYHYGPVAAESRQHHVWFHELGGCDLSGPGGITKFLQDFFESLWVPQMMAFVSFQLDRLLRDEQRQAEFVSTSPVALDAMRARREQLERWRTSPQPFSWREYEPLVQQVVVPLSRIAVLHSTKARQDYSRELYQHCWQKGMTGSGAFASSHATWISILSNILRGQASSLANTDHWVAALSAATLSQGIDCMPGVYQSRLSHRRVIRLVGYATPLAVLSAPEGSLKRAALEAQHRGKRMRVPSRIEFGCPFPFVRIPDLIHKGFQKLEQPFQQGNRRVLEHYRVAHNCLEACLGSPECDLLLILVMTFGSCSVTPTVLPNTKGFAAGARHDAESFAACLATRMLWFLQPSHFPKNKEWPNIMGISEITKKIQHKGVNNRLLRQLGWVKVIRGKRDDPRNTDLILQDRSELLQRRRDLVALMKDAPRFIRLVFQSYDSVWVDRCTEIITTMERGRFS